MDVVTLREARERGLVRYFTGKPCKRGHVCERQTSSAWQEANREHMRALSRAWKARNPDYRRRYA